MNRNITLQNGSASPDVATIKAVSEPSRELVRFPGNDGGESLGAMAQRDLDAALQLLAERAQYITGATGAAIALGDQLGMICRASVGDCAPALGLRVQTDSGLSGESVRTRQILRCDDADSDTRVNRESCRALGIASVVVMPLISNDQVSGLFELFSGKPFAFEERDIVALQRLSEMIQTALAHADAVKLTERELTQSEPGKAEDQPGPQPQSAIANAAGQVGAQDIPEGSKPDETQSPANSTNPILTELDSNEEVDEEAKLVLAERGNIGKCSSCGFPVSQGRELCVDCEKKRSTEESSADTPAFLSEVGEGSQESWLESHKYVLGALVLIVVLIAGLVWLR